MSATSPLPSLDPHDRVPEHTPDPLLDGTESADPETALAVLAEGSRSFSFAGLFLSGDTRRDAAVVYALCRTIDDLADEAPSEAEARSNLDRVEAELRGEIPASPWVEAALEVFARRDIDVAHALNLVHGVRTDLDEVRIADDDGLIRYGYHVASTVGLMMCGVLGVREEEALPFAVDLGVAMQITNICRDVAEDAHRRRVYLPATRLSAHGVEPSPEGVLAGGSGVAATTDELLSLADLYYRSAEHGMRFIPWRARIAILVASRVYRGIGVRLRRRGSDPLAGRTVVPLGGKLRWALRGLMAALRSPWMRHTHRDSLHRPLRGLPGTSQPPAAGRD